MIATYLPAYLPNVFPEFLPHPEERLSMVIIAVDSNPGESRSARTSCTSVHTIPVRRIRQS